MRRSHSCWLYKGFFSKFPTQRNREFQRANRETLSADQGTFRVEQGTCPLAHLAIAGAIPPETSSILRSPKRQIISGSSPQRRAMYSTRLWMCAAMIYPAGPGACDTGE